MHTQEEGTVVCAPVAIWNANKYLKSKKMPSLRSIIKECDVTQEHGTWYWNVTKTLKAHKMYSEGLSNGFPLIILYSWGKNRIFEGSHYVLATMNKGSITVWNDGRKSKITIYSDWRSLEKDILVDCPSLREYKFPFFWKIYRAS
jgi:hypothetical protein